MSDAESSPGSPFRPRHTAAQWLVLITSIALVLGCLGGAGALLYAKGQLDNTLAAPAVDLSTTSGPAGSVAGTDTVGTGSVAGDSAVPTTPETFPAADPQAQNFLITGSDANACVDPNSPWAGAADPARQNIGDRSDTIMMMRLDPATHQAAVLSFPRDLWVKIPGRSKNRINSAFVLGDSRLLAQTIFDNFGVPTDHYLQVDFCAFKKLVDAVGGVSVPFTTPIQDLEVGLNITAPGCHTFVGDEALAYVRSRKLKWVDASGKTHKDQASDLGRISRQQDFLRRTLEAALRKGVFDPKVASALIESMQKYIVRDEGLLSLDSMLAFAGVLRGVQPGSIRTYQIEVARMFVGTNDVLDARIGGANMKSILAIFRGQAPLAGAPDQVFESTTTSSTSSTAPSRASTTTTAATPTTATSSTVAEPDQNVKGDILPDPTVVCP